MTKKNRYSNLIAKIFEKKYIAGDSRVSFERTDFVSTASELGIDLPLNLGDIVYSFRYRAVLPSAITATAPSGSEWVIRPVGQSKYEFSLTDFARFLPNVQLAETKIPDATPGIIKCYAMNDEQGLLAKVRYNRLIDIFTGVTCHSLQNHFRTTVPGIGQVETDELYVGIDKRGAQYIFPVQAKGGTDQLGVVQIEQDFALCQAKFPGLIAIPIATQFIASDLIAMFSFEQEEKTKKVRILSERHYRLVMPDGISNNELLQYRTRIIE
jgi:hypothetical protein